MTTHELLFQLRGRLRLVNERIVERTEQQGRGPGYDLHAGGALTELHSERLFLAGLIADLEREGVQP